MSHSEDGLVWTDEIPTLKQLGGFGGEPGLEYLYCDSAHEFEAQQNAGWARVKESPVLQMTGAAGTCAFVVMQRGEIAKGISRGPAQPLSISDHLSRATGLGLQPDEARFAIAVAATAAKQKAGAAA